MKYTIKSAIEKTWQDKKFIESILVDDKNEEYKVSFWNGEITTTSTEIEGELEKNDKGYWKLVTPKKKASAGFASRQKDESIEKAQDRKTKAIFAAQDRSAWMWARNSAASLIANHSAYKNVQESELLDLLEDMATKIYNMEPNEPFTS